MKNIFLNLFKESQELKELNKSLNEGMSPIALFGIWDSAMSAILTSIEDIQDQDMLIITSSDKMAKNIAEDIEIMSDHRVVYMPTKEIIFFDAFAHSNKLIFDRTKALNDIVSNEKVIVVTCIDNLLLKYMSPKLYHEHLISLKVEHEYNVEKLLEKLVNIGYERVDMVDSKGHFALRGGILDIYAPNADHPVRVEFWGDEIESIRMFDETTQLSSKTFESYEVIPSQEIIIDDNARLRALSLFEEEKLSLESDDQKYSKICKITEALKEGIYVDGMDKYFSYLFEKGYSLLDYFNKQPLVAIVDDKNTKIKAEGYLYDIKEQIKNNLEAGHIFGKQGNAFFAYEYINELIKMHQLLIINNLKRQIRDYKLDQMISFKSFELSRYFGKLKTLVEDLKRWESSHYKILIVMNSEEKGRRLSNNLMEFDLNIPYVESIDHMNQYRTCIISDQLKKGFIFETFKVVVLTEYEIFDANRDQKKKKKKKSGKQTFFRNFKDLDKGSLVVHENHGIGKYLGVEQLHVDGVKKDYVKIQYSDGGILYVAIEQLDSVQKYIGGAVGSVKMHKLGGARWQKTKQRAKKAVEDMTDELIALYAQREKRKGYAFSKDGEWQKQFEDLFPYEETDDQKKCIEEIKKDMESQQPMERLLCGDVGFGKTEVALRAIFKAVFDGKQVAILVPTTILAQQHYTNMVERFSKFPINVEMLNRFRTKKEQTVILKKLQKGSVDVIVGTHRLLSKDVVFKDIGLLVIDEEQRFGVRHKETIKQYKNQVDVLSLSATPIPRTLHMSLTGIRDMSVIEEPPEDRYPIQTYVAEFDLGIIKNALQREIQRNGQAYFVHNRVSDIVATTKTLQRLMPDADIRYAHGQMNSKKLEKIMLSFLNHEFDVLVCTTIIETGLDISNVNTMIINDSDKMGLSQLYQLRGRVGRSNKMAYAYLFYKPDKVLTEIAQKRLKAIKRFTELGSGFKISMQDLEIRGAGNVLGAQQSGHLAQVGYEMYCKLLEENVRKVKGESVKKTIETEIDINLDAFIPEKYISNASQKIDMYKKISLIETQEEVYAIEDELQDVYGDIPKEVYNLVNISYIKTMAQELDIALIKDLKTQIKFVFDKNYTVKPKFIGQVTQAYDNKIVFNLIDQPFFTYKLPKKVLKRNKEGRLFEIIGILQTLKEFDIQEK